MAAGGNIITKKYGPLPGWAWAGLAVGAFLIYRQRKASEAAAAAGSSGSSTATASPTASLPTSDVTAPSGYGYQGPGTDLYNPGPIPTGAMAVTASSATGEKLTSGGYSLPSGFTGPFVSSSGDSYDPIANGQILSQLIAQGTPTYYQPAPGVFTSTDKANLPAGTPVFIKQ